MVIHIQRFFGLKHEGIIYVGNVNELSETHSQLPTECKVDGDGSCESMRSSCDCSLCVLVPGTAYRVLKAAK